MKSILSKGPATNFFDVLTAGVMGLMNKKIESCCTLETCAAYSESGIRVHI